jgi:glycosyltransferase involved in cell wall biosynthesis
MKILMLPSIYGGVSWWRFDIPSKALKAAGYDVTCLNYDETEEAVRQAGSFYSWLRSEAEKHDILHCGYTGVMDAATTIYRIRDECKIPVVVDVDDDLDHVPTYNPGWKSFYPSSIGQRIAKTQLAHANAITLSTKPLAEALAYLVKDTPSAILENWIDVDSWDCPTPPERSLDESVRVMVTGGNGRFGDWAIIKDPLEAAMAKFDGRQGRPMLRLFFLGGTPDWVLPWVQDRLDPLANRCFYIHPTRDVEPFNRAVRYVAPDIILSPVQKNDFNRSKSGLKFLEAALAGAAFLCTDFDTYSLAPQGTCLKVDNTYTQWVESIEALVEDPALRRSLANSAREFVVDKCQAKDHVYSRIEFYTSVLEGKPICRPSQVQEVAPVATSAPDKS